MKAILSASSLGLGALVLAGAAPQTPQSSLPIPLRALTNLLGNGGMETWGQGTSFQGPLWPDGWIAMGDTSDVFTQGDIAFTRVSGCPPGGNASHAMQIRANLPQNFVSQSAENFGEYAGRDVTFSLSVRPLFPVANARIEIDDGVGSSSALITVSAGNWGRVTVRHAVALCPTKLEFKIFPEQTIDVDEAMAIVGRQSSAEFVPRPNPEPALQEVPLGVVIDWYRFDANIPVPEGFAICDGSAVADAASPFVGRPTPNLADRFVRGVTSVGAIGSSGGASSVNLAHTHSINHSHSEDIGFDFWLDINGAGRPVIDVNPFSGPSGSSLGSVSILPPYVGLLKLVRIK